MRGLTTEVIIAAGVAVVVDNGWAALSVRAVATRLGVTPMALYRHVDDGASLTHGVISRIVDEIGHVERTGDMFGDVARWARHAHDALRRYPGAAGHLLVAWFQIPPMLRSAEELLEVVHDDGLRDFEAVAAVNSVLMYVLMRSEAEQSVRTAGAVKRSLRLAIADEPLPYLSALAAHYTTAQFDLHFDYGLDVLLSGIASRRVAR